MYFQQQHAFEIFAYFFLFTGCVLILYYLIKTRINKQLMNKRMNLNKKVIQDDARRTK
jgi:hypothetical protein